MYHIAPGTATLQPLSGSLQRSFHRSLTEEYLLDHSFGRVSIVQIVELIIKCPIFLIHLEVLRQITDRRDQTIFFLDDGARQLIQRKVEPTQAIPVVIHVIHIIDDGSSQVGVVKEHAGIVCHQKIRHQVQIVDIIVLGHIVDEAFVFPEVELVGHQIVGAEEDHIILPQFPLQLRTG